MDMAGLESLLVVMVIAAIAPLVTAILPGPRIAHVVILLLGGIAVGPDGLGMQPNQHVRLISDVGVGFLFLLAGYELSPSALRGKPARLALVAWVVSVAVAVSVVVGLQQADMVEVVAPLAIALTTTALGTLLPVLQDGHMLTGSLGRFVLPTGAVGELFPIVAMALFLGLQSKFVALIALGAIVALGALLALLWHGVRGRAVHRIVAAGAETTGQTTLRWTIVLLLVLIVATGEVGLDAVLGAFLAGMVLRHWIGDEPGALTDKLQAVGYGFFIPVFFVYSGMNLHLTSIIEAPALVFVLLGLLVLVRGLPTLVVHFRAVPRVTGVQLALCSATTLPLLVALSEVSLRNGSMTPEGAAALVGAGVVSVLLFPTLAVALHERRQPET